MEAALRPIDEGTLLKAIRLGISLGAEQIHFRPGHLPLYTWDDGVRQLDYRQLTRDDTAAIATLLLERAIVPGRIASDPTDAAHALAIRWELPGEALLEANLGADRGGLAVSLEIVRPMSPAR